jgi:hypothetical protein
MNMADFCDVLATKVSNSESIERTYVVLYRAHGINVENQTLHSLTRTRINAKPGPSGTGFGTWTTSPLVSPGLFMEYASIMMTVMNDDGNNLLFLCEVMRGFLTVRKVFELN